MAKYGSTETKKYASLVKSTTKRPNQGGGKTAKQKTNKGSYAVGEKRESVSYFCNDCDSWYGPLGMEPTLELFVYHIVLIFREIFRVLRDDGIAFLNLGDSMNGSGGAGGDYNKGGRKKHDARYYPVKQSRIQRKSMMGVPWRCAIALMDDGWNLRTDLPWCKPSSLDQPKDRPMKAHEYIFMLTKHPNYWYDDYAATEPSSTPAGTVGGKSSKSRGKEGQVASTPTGGKISSGRRPYRSWWFMNTAKGAWEYCMNCDSLFTGKEKKKIEEDPEDEEKICPKCNTKSMVKHFAAFPEEMPEHWLNMATSAHGACADCGAQYNRILDITYLKGKKRKQGKQEDWTKGGSGSKKGGKNTGDFATGKIMKHSGWEKSCECETDEVVPSIICDPFMGSGTTAMVADRMGRAWIGSEISPEYATIIAARVAHQRTIKNVHVRQTKLFGEESIIVEG